MILRVFSSSVGGQSVEVDRRSLGGSAHHFGHPAFGCNIREVNLDFSRRPHLHLFATWPTTVPGRAHAPHIDQVTARLSVAVQDPATMRRVVTDRALPLLNNPRNYHCTQNLCPSMTSVTSNHYSRYIWTFKNSWTLKTFQNEK